MSNSSTSTKPAQPSVPPATPSTKEQPSTAKGQQPARPLAPDPSLAGSQRRVSDVRTLVGAQAAEFVSKTLARSPPPSPVGSGASTPTGSTVPKPQRLLEQQPHTKRQRAIARTDDSSSSDDRSSRPRKKAPPQQVSPRQVIKPLSAITAALEEVSNYVHSAESKLNKTQAALIQRQLDKAQRAAQELSVQNAFLAGRCRNYEESAADSSHLTGALASQLKKAIPSTSPIIRAVKEVDANVKEIIKLPKSHPPTDNNDLIQAVTRMESRADQRHRELVTLHRTGHARSAKPGPERPRIPSKAPGHGSATHEGTDITSARKTILSDVH